MADLSHRFTSADNHALEQQEEETFDLSDIAESAQPEGQVTYASSTESMNAALDKLSAAVTSYITVRTLGAEMNRIFLNNKRFVLSCVASLVASGVLLTGAIHSELSLFVTVMFAGAFLLLNGVMSFSLSRKCYQKDIKINDLFADNGFHQFLSWYFSFCFMVTAAAFGSSVAISVPASSILDDGLPAALVVFLGFTLAAAPLLYMTSQAGLILPALAARRLTSFNISLLQTSGKTDTLYKILVSGASVCAVAVLFGASLQVSSPAIIGLCMTFFGFWTIFASVLFCAFYSLSGRAKDPNYELR